MLLCFALRKVKNLAGSEGSWRLALWVLHPKDKNVILVDVVLC